MGSAFSSTKCNVEEVEEVVEATPWKAAFLEDIAQMQGREFAFASLHHISPGMESSSKRPPFVPHARFCAFRCFWAELPNNPSNPAVRNKSTFVSDLPTFTTDVRTNKLRELFSGSNESQNDEGDDVEASGGGGMCEAVWWATSRLKQWRIKGRAFVIAPDIEGHSDAAEIVKRELGYRMRVVREAEVKDWSWKRELTAHFGNLSPIMRGMFDLAHISVEIPENDEAMTTNFVCVQVDT